MNEKRIEPRWQINQAADLTISGGVKPISCRVEDLSPGGMCISMRRNLFPEVFSNFSLELSDNFVLDLSAHVAWQDQGEEKNIFGLAFNRVEESLRCKIHEYVKISFPEVMARPWRGGM